MKKLALLTILIASVQINAFAARPMNRVRVNTSLTDSIKNSSIATVAGAGILITISIALGLTAKTMTGHLQISEDQKLDIKNELKTVERFDSLINDMRKGLVADDLAEIYLSDLEEGSATEDFIEKYRYLQEENSLLKINMTK